jgi:hypothetical protein
LSPTIARVHAPSRSVITRRPGRRAQAGVERCVMVAAVVPVCARVGRG